MKNLEAELAHITGHSEHAPPMEFKPIRVTRLPLHQWTEDDVTRLVLAQNSELQALASEVQVSDAGLPWVDAYYLVDESGERCYEADSRSYGRGTGFQLCSGTAGLSRSLFYLEVEICHARRSDNSCPFRVRLSFKIRFRGHLDLHNSFRR